MSMDLSVIVVNYNVKAYIDQCLRSVQRASQGLQVEVIVVDNASSDGSVAFLNGWKYLIRNGLKRVGG